MEKYLRPIWKIARWPLLLIVIPLWLVTEVFTILDDDVFQ